MKRTIVFLAAAVVISVISPVASADAHLELGLDVSPTLVQDPAFEAFSSSDLRSDRFGADLRVEVASFWRNIKLLPVIGYRISLDDGSPYDQFDTALQTHDLFAGLRFRGWFKPWMAAFLQVTGGACWARMEADISDINGGMGLDEYRARDVTWTVEGLVGLEFRLSPAFLARRGITRFNFGGEIGGGYLRRGEMQIDPELGGGDEHSLPVEQIEPWGDVNLSGWVVQIGLTLSFF